MAKGLFFLVLIMASNFYLKQALANIEIDAAITGGSESGTLVSCSKKNKIDGQILSYSLNKIVSSQNGKLVPIYQLRILRQFLDRRAALKPIDLNIEEVFNTPNLLVATSSSRSGYVVFIYKKTRKSAVIDLDITNVHSTNGLSEGLHCRYYLEQ